MHSPLFSPVFCYLWNRVVFARSAQARHRRAHYELVSSHTGEARFSFTLAWTKLKRQALSLLGLLAVLPYNVLMLLDRLLHNFEEVKTCRRIA
jgi:hypothetical protein